MSSQRLALLLLVPLLASALAGCAHAPDPKAKDQAAIHYDLGVQALSTCDSRAALTELKRAIELDPDFDRAHHALGLVYHLSFAQFEDAIRHYRRALELSPKFSDAYTNLANVYLDQGAWDEAMPLYEKALSDILYATPFIAENNLGWCYHKKGETKTGIDHIRSALITNPMFCLGHRNLGLIYAETGEPQKALESFAAYAKHCPESPDAHYQYGVALLKTGDNAGARRELTTCAEATQARAKEPPRDADAPKTCQKMQEYAVSEECKKLLSLLNQQ